LCLKYFFLFPKRFNRYFALISDDIILYSVIGSDKKSQSPNKHVKYKERQRTVNNIFSFKFKITADTSEKKFSTQFKYFV